MELHYCLIRPGLVWYKEIITPKFCAVQKCINIMGCSSKVGRQGRIIGIILIQKLQKILYQLRYKLYVWKGYFCFPASFISTSGFPFFTFSSLFSKNSRVLQEQGWFFKECASPIQLRFHLERSWQLSECFLFGTSVNLF